MVMGVPWLHSEPGRLGLFCHKDGTTFILVVHSPGASVQAVRMTISVLLKDTSFMYPFFSFFPSIIFNFN